MTRSPRGHRGDAGIDAENVLTVPLESVSEGEGGHRPADKDSPEYVEEASPLPRVLYLRATPHLFTSTPRRAMLIPVRRDRTFGEPLVFDCRNAMPSLTEPHDSLVYVYWTGPHGLSEDNHRGDSAVWWNAPEGFSAARTTRLPTSGPHGMTSVEPGNIADRGPEEFFVSEPYRVPEGSSVESIR